VSDQTTSVEELKTTVAKFVAARDWERYHGPKNLAMSISIEAAEIMEHFQWLTVEEADESMADPKVREEVEEGRFPVEKVKGFGVEKDSEMGK
jgi:NTP pyrophosphatase (non-canonical NTP hydrolase)